MQLCAAVATFYIEVEIAYLFSFFIEAGSAMQEQRRAADIRFVFAAIPVVAKVVIIEMGDKLSGT